VVVKERGRGPVKKNKPLHRLKNQLRDKGPGVENPQKKKKNVPSILNTHLRKQGESAANGGKDGPRGIRSSPDSL